MLADLEFENLPGVPCALVCGILTCWKMNMKTRTFLTSVLTTLVLLACSGAPAVVGDRSAGAPGGEAVLANRLDELGYSNKTEIKRLSNFRLNGWSYVDPYHVIINAGPSRNYLVRFRTRCHDLRQAHSVGFTSTVGSVSRGDKMIVRDLGERLQDCWVDSIFELTKKPREEQQEK